MIYADLSVKEMSPDEVENLPEAKPESRRPGHLWNLAESTAAAWTDRTRRARNSRSSGGIPAVR